ncbi:MAG TPA: pyridoxal-phosphate dependent enzyme [Solirubrobacteraceae bacterium]|nr:pyridoxal-phosphate dependent enzyme [Solirubrobacteraceae bacterium]
MIHERFPQTRDTLPRVALCDLPTPVRRLEGLGVEDLWIKDDSRSAPLWGGNKPRKLEWVFGDARARGRGTILTFGGLATNHGLATALYARGLGVRCVLVLVDQPWDEHVAAQLERIRASGARVHVTRTTPRTALALPWLLARYRPYLLPPGGSSPVGTLGFVEAALELGEQVRAGELPEPEAIVLALGSGGSVAGLVAGLRLAGLRSRVHAVLVNDKLKLDEKMLRRLAERARARLRRAGAQFETPLAELQVVHGFMGAGYGHATPEGDAAVRAGAEHAGLELEPVYTGKALAAILAGAIPASGPTLYWHTHGAVD